MSDSIAMESRQAHVALNENTTIINNAGTTHAGESAILQKMPATKDNTMAVIDVAAMLKAFHRRRIHL